MLRNDIFQKKAHIKDPKCGCHKLFSNLFRSEKTRPSKYRHLNLPEKKKRIVTDKNRFDPKNKKKSRNQFKALNRGLQLT